jgi:aspartate aminotransferase
VITVNGVAKGHAMTGWRIGFIAAAKWIADGVEKLQGQVTSGTNSIAQKASVAAFNGPLDHAHEMKEAYDRRRKLVVGKLREIPGFKVNMPDGAFYAFPDISYYFGKSDGKTTIKDSDDFCTWLLMDAFVATVAGSGFGAPDCMRISTAAADEQLEEACERIKVAVAKLK